MSDLNKLRGGSDGLRNVNRLTALQFVGKMALALSGCFVAFTAVWIG